MVFRPLTVQDSDLDLNQVICSLGKHQKLLPAGFKMGSFSVLMVSKTKSSFGYSHKKIQYCIEKCVDYKGFVNKILNTLSFSS